MQTKTKTEVYFHFIFCTHFLYNNIVFFSCEYFCVSLLILVSSLSIYLLCSFLLFLLTDSLIEFQLSSCHCYCPLSQMILCGILFLPVKNLSFASEVCVCKSWNSTFSNSLFAKDYRWSIKDPTLANNHLLLSFDLQCLKRTYLISDMQIGFTGARESLTYWTEIMLTHDSVMP